MCSLRVEPHLVIQRENWPFSRLVDEWWLTSGSLYIIHSPAEFLRSKLASVPNLCRVFSKFGCSPSLSPLSLPTSFLSFHLFSSSSSICSRRPLLMFSANFLLLERGSSLPQLKGGKGVAVFSSYSSSKTFDPISPPKP